MKTKHLFGFGPFRLDAEERVLLREGQPVSLPPKDLETLLVLVEKAGHIVEKEEILEKVWAGVFVEEGNLSRRIFNLRQVLGDTEDGRNYIETIPRRGYRFVAAIQEDGAFVPAPAAALPSEHLGTAAPSVHKKNHWAWSLVLLALAVSTYFVGRRFWPRPSPAPQKVMLAVLPFVNLSGDA